MELFTLFVVGTWLPSVSPSWSSTLSIDFCGLIVNPAARSRYRTSPKWNEFILGPTEKEAIIQTSCRKLRRTPPFNWKKRSWQWYSHIADFAHVGSLDRALLSNLCHSIHLPLCFLIKILDRAVSRRPLKVLDKSLDIFLQSRLHKNLLWRNFLSN